MAENDLRGRTNPDRLVTERVLKDKIQPAYTGVDTNDKPAKDSEIT